MKQFTIDQYTVTLGENAKNWNLSFHPIQFNMDSS